jgi:hypothetical protein
MNSLAARLQSHARNQPIYSAYHLKRGNTVAYILHLMDAPSITTAEEADTYIDEQRSQSPSESPKFAAFVADITAVYPDLSDEDDDGDNDENLWEEGIDSEPSYGNVMELVVKMELTDAAVIDALVKAAVKNDLKLYDAEGQVVYPE